MPGGIFWISASWAPTNSTHRGYFTPFVAGGPSCGRVRWTPWSSWFEIKVHDYRRNFQELPIVLYSPQKLTWNPKNWGLEDDSPLQTGVSGSMLVFRGVSILPGWFATLIWPWIDIGCLQTHQIRHCIRWSSPSQSSNFTSPTSLHIYQQTHPPSNMGCLQRKKMYIEIKNPSPEWVRIFQPPHQYRTRDHRLGKSEGGNGVDAQDWWMEITCRYW